MASPLEIQQQIDNLQGQIDAFNQATSIGTGKLQVGNITYTTAQVQKSVKDLQKRIKTLKKTIEPYTQAQQKLDEATARLRRAQEIAASPITESATGMSASQAQEEVKKAQAEVNKLIAPRDKAFSVDYKVSEGIPSGEEKASAGMFRQVESAFGMPSAGGGAGAGGKGGGAPGTGVGTGAGGRVAKEKKQKAITNWEPIFREQFPSQAWLLDLDRAKYPQLFKLLQQGVSEKMYESEAGATRFAALLQNTDFYKELATTDKVRQVKNLVGDLGFDSMPFNAFLTKSMNMGWTGDVLAQEAYKEVFRKDDNGNYVNPTALTRVKQSKSYLDVANIGKQYFNNVDEKTIESRLTGQITDEDVSRQQRSLAKAKYGHLSDLIDQGLTLEAISDSFKRQASDILERDYNSIDMSQADFERAFNFGEEGKKRLMTSGEWEINLRSDARYGWDKTENAKREARSLASSIAQAFGKVI